MPLLILPAETAVIVRGFRRCGGQHDARRLPSKERVASCHWPIISLAWQGKVHSIPPPRELIEQTATARAAPAAPRRPLVSVGSVRALSLGSALPPLGTNTARGLEWAKSHPAERCRNRGRDAPNHRFRFPARTPHHTRPRRDALHLFLVFV